MSRTRWAAALALILGAGFVLAACGGGSSTTTVQTRTVVRVVTTGTTSTTATPGVADTIVPGSTPGSIDTSDGGLNGFVPFARNSPWNTFADSQSVDMRSSALMRRARVRVGVKDNGNGFPKTFPETHNDGLYINTVKWTDVVTTTVSGVPTPLVCRQPPLLPRLHDYCGDGWSVSSLSIPVNASPFPQYDGLVHDHRPRPRRRVRPLARPPQPRRPVDLVSVHAQVGPQRRGVPRAQHRLGARVGPAAVRRNDLPVGAPGRRPDQPRTRHLGARRGRRNLRPARVVDRRRRRRGLAARGSAHQAEGEDHREVDHRALHQPQLRQHVLRHPHEHPHQALSPVQVPEPHEHPRNGRDHQGAAHLWRDRRRPLAGPHALRAVQHRLEQGAA